MPRIMKILESGIDPAWPGKGCKTLYRVRDQMQCVVAAILAKPLCYGDYYGPGGGNGSMTRADHEIFTRFRPVMPKFMASDVFLN